MQTARQARSSRRSIDQPRRTTKVLLSCTIGSGKSTELGRVAEARAQKGDEFVIVLDLFLHFNKVVGDSEALQSVTSWEVCFLVGLALIRAAKEICGYDFTPELISQLGQAWTELARASHAGGAAGSTATIDILGVVKSMTLVASTAALPVAAAAGASAAVGVAAAGGLKLLSELAGSVKWTLPFGKKGAKPLPDQDEQMKTLLDKVNLLLAAFQQWNRRVLVVVDGLDRIVDSDRAESLFVRSQMIARLNCALVVCAPFALRNAMAATEARGFRLRTLHNAPVLDHENPTKPGPGVPFLGEVFRRRVRDLGAEGIIPQALLDELAYYSGGRLRDFVKSISMLAECGWDDDASVATPEHVKDVLKEARQLV